jgi:hypothetical protein
MVIDQCDWNNPGNNPFMGELPAAVSKYTEIPSEDRAKIIKAMETRKYDDIVLISRTAILGSFAYSPKITNMHFGNGSVCKTIDRSKWKDSHFERALTYCSGEYCVIVPTVCRNVSIVHKNPRKDDHKPVDTHHNTVPEPEGILALALLCAIYFTKNKHV